MASSSVVNKCFHCEGSCVALRNGWDLSTGKFAQICKRCYSIYRSGRFCETFHKKHDDWRICQFCSKPLHCSCLVSLNEWFLLKGGREEVICKECIKITSFLERNFSNVTDLAEGIKKYEISKHIKSAIVPMFEKLLTVGDIDNKDGSIVIPKKYAEAYLPEVTDPQGIQLYVIDDKGFKEWYPRYRFWLNKMYVVEELKEYMVSNKLQAGDTLTFSRLVLDGPYVIGFKKGTNPCMKPSRKASTRRGK